MAQANEAVLQVNPSEDEGLFERLEHEITSAAPSSKPAPTPAKKRTAKRKNLGQDAYATASSSKCPKQDNAELREAVASLQQTVASLTAAFTERNQRNASSSTAFPSNPYDGASEGEIIEPDEPANLINFVPEKGEKRATNAPEMGDDTFNECELENLLSGGQTDELLTEMAALVDSDAKESPALNEQIAKTINSLAQGKIQSEKLEEKLNKYDKPINCPNLCLTRVNPEIWSILKPTTRARDVKFQRIQNSFVRGTVAISMVTDLLLKGRNNEAALDTAQLIRMLVDAVAILGAGNSQLNLRRRDNIRPDLSMKYAPLCSSQVPCTNLLFGDDLVQSCKSIQETSKIGSKLHGIDNTNRRYNKFAPGREVARRSGDLRSSRAFPGQYNGRQQRAPYYQRRGGRVGRGGYRTGSSSLYHQQGLGQGPHATGPSPRKPTN